MEQFAPYSHAIASLALFALIVLILSPVSAARKSAAGVEAGGTPTEDYSDPVYRLYRAYMNAMENSGPFALATISAILVGASPIWVNWLASIFLVARIVHLVIHIAGLGKPNMGVRSIVFTIGWACCGILAIFALIGAFAL